MSRHDRHGGELPLLLSGLRVYLESLRRSGVMLLGPAAGIRREAGEAVGSGETLEDVRETLGDCTRCALCEHRSSIVFGQGSPRARLVFVGGAPTAGDDAAGAPFTGEAGEMLTNIITRVLGLTRPDVYITTVVKCAPPAQREPWAREIGACLPFLHRQLAAIGPAIVCALGPVAAQALLGRDEKLDEVRGRFHQAGGMLVMPTYEPAFLMKHTGKKRQTWHDMQMIHQAYSRPPSPA